VVNDTPRYSRPCPANRSFATANIRVCPSYRALGLLAGVGGR